MPKHISKSGGILGAFKVNKSGKKTVSLINKAKLKAGKQMRGCCIHWVGGTGPATLTAARKARIHKEHAHGMKKVTDGVHCHLHVKNWKQICLKGAA